MRINFNPKDYDAIYNIAVKKLGYPLDCFLTDDVIEIDDDDFKKFVDYIPSINNNSILETSKVNISKLAYELYKLDWKESHNITPEEEASALKDYFEGLIDSPSNYTFAEYIEEFVYKGMLYVCYEEFCDAEYLEEEYIRSLLKDEHLIKLYLEDLKERG